MDLCNRHERFSLSLSPVFMAIVAFCFSMTIGVLWEFFECAMDQFFLLDMQKDTVISSISSVLLDPTGRQRPFAIHGITDLIVVANGEQIPLGLGGYLDIGLLDTMNDLLVNFIGAAVFSFRAILYVKNRGKGRFTRNFIPQVLSHRAHSEEASDAAVLSGGRRAEFLRSSFPDGINRPAPGHTDLIHCEEVIKQWIRKPVIPVFTAPSPTAPITPPRTAAL